MYALIETGGKQYRVTEGDVIQVEKIDLPVGSIWEENRVLMISNDGPVLVGTPTLAGAKVVGEIIEQGRGEKIVVFKYKRRKNYRRTQGHRQSYTGIKVTKILSPDKIKTS
jgi:large subunit ribosomal protein L21